VPTSAGVWLDLSCTWDTWNPKGGEIASGSQVPQCLGPISFFGPCFLEWDAPGVGMCGKVNTWPAISLPYYLAAHQPAWIWYLLKTSIEGLGQGVIYSLSGMGRHGPSPRSFPG
jgi:hypothetical protein